MRNIKITLNHIGKTLNQIKKIAALIMIKEYGKIFGMIKLSYSLSHFFYTWTNTYLQKLRVDFYYSVICLRIFSKISKLLFPHDIKCNISEEENISLIYAC